MVCTPVTSNFTPEQLVSASLMRLSTSDRNPFIATLAMMAPIVITEDIETAATDGERLYFNAAFLSGLSPAERDGLLVHEVLHAALLHVTRRGSRQPLLWNIACDIVVNGMIAAEAAGTVTRQGPSLALPQGSLRDEKLEHLTVEELYEVLIRRNNTLKKYLALQDLRPDLRGLSPGSKKPDRNGKGRSPASNSGGPGRRGGSSQAGGEGGPKQSNERPTSGPPSENAGPMDAETRRRIEDRWNQAIAKAASVSMARGELPALIQRHFGRLLAPQVDWRTRLWQYLARTPDDFTGFDRRLIWHGLYVEQLEGESVHVDVCVDTSGSIDEKLLSAFLGEVKGIVNAYERIHTRLYYADAACHGPFPLAKADEGMPPPKGGGGTHFGPFFDATRHHERDAQGGMRLLVYLTDGEGAFPKRPPDQPCLWVVTPGGRDEGGFPFGEVVRMT